MRIVRAEALTQGDRVVFDMDTAPSVVAYVNEPSSTGGSFVLVMFTGDLLQEPFRKWFAPGRPVVVAD